MVELDGSSTWSGGKDDVGIDTDPFAMDSNTTSFPLVATPA